MRAGDRADEQHGVEVDVGVEPGERQCGAKDSPGTEVSIRGSFEVSTANARRAASSP